MDYAELMTEAIGSVATLAPPMVELIAEGIRGWVAELERMRLGPTAAGTVREIIQGINNGVEFRAATGAEKQQAARAAIGQYIINHGGEATDSAINTLIEVALKAEGITPQTEVPA